MNSLQQQFYFIPQPHLAQHAFYELDEMTTAHLFKVLRCTVGKSLMLTNGKGILAQAILTHIDKKKGVVQITHTTAIPPKKYRIRLAVSMLKNVQRWEWMLEKIVELGVDEIIPLRCRRTEAKGQLKNERAERILLSAMLQSQSVWMPHLHPLRSLDEFLTTPALTPHCGYIAHCVTSSVRTPLAQRISMASSDHVLLIGPEGDFDEKEIERATALGYTAVSLGTRRLRTETAALYGISLLASALDTSSF